MKIIESNVRSLSLQLSQMLHFCTEVTCNYGMQYTLFLRLRFAITGELEHQPIDAKNFFTCWLLCLEDAHTIFGFYTPVFLG